MSPIVLIVALLFGLVAAAYYVRALQQIQPLATHSRMPAAQRRTLDIPGWLKSVPPRARRDYVRSLGYSCVFIICIGILAYREGVRVIAVIFAGIALLGAALTLAHRLRARR